VISKISKLGDVCKIESGNSIPVKEKDDLFKNVNEGLPYVATKDVGFNGLINYENGVRIPSKHGAKFRVSKKDSVLICAEGGSAGRKIAYSNRDCHFVNKLFSIKPDNEIDSKYIYYYTLGNEFQSQFKKSMHGLIGGVSLSKIKSFQITHPLILEQKRIVAKLDKMFKEIEQLHISNVRKVKNIKATRLKIFDKIIKDNCKKLRMIQLNDLIDENCTLSYGIVQPGEDVLNGLPLIRPVNLKQKYITLNGLKKIKASVADVYKRTKLRGTEVLLSVRGSTGVVGLATPELKGANVTRGIIPVSFDDGLVDREFGYYAMLSEYTQQQIQDKTYGTALQQINVKDVKKILVKIPELKEQKTIVQKIKVIEELLLHLETINSKQDTNVSLFKSALLTQEMQNEVA